MLVATKSPTNFVAGLYKRVNNEATYFINNIFFVSTKLPVISSEIILLIMLVINFIQTFSIKLLNYLLKVPALFLLIHS